MNYSAVAPLRTTPLSAIGTSDLFGSEAKLLISKSNRAVAVAVVVRQDGHGRSVLLVKRRPTSHGELVWVFPGGKIEGGEGAKRAAQRELYEETGVVADNCTIIGKRVHPVSKVAVTYVACEYKSFEPQASPDGSVEHAEWVSPRQLNQKFGGQLFEKVRDYLSGSSMTSQKAVKLADQASFAF